MGWGIEDVVVMVVVEASCLRFLSGLFAGDGERVWTQAINEFWEKLEIVALRAVALSLA